MVQTEGQALATQADAAQTVERNACGAGLRAGPAARGVGLGAHECQAKLHTGQGHLRPICGAELGVEVFAAQGQQADLDAGGRFVHCRTSGVCGEFDGGAVGQEGKVAVDPEEVAQHQVGTAHVHRLDTRAQAAKGVIGARHVDGAAGSIEVGAVPAHGGRGRRQRDGLAQGHVGRARGLDQHPGVALGCIADDEG